MIVLDSSAAVDYLASREPREWVDEHVQRDPDVHAPHLLDVEVASGLRRLVMNRELSARAAAAALEDLGDLDVARYAHLELLDRIWELRAHVTPYDAVYVALAEVLDATLVTTDGRLARAHGHRARIVSP